MALNRNPHTQHDVFDRIDEPLNHGDPEIQRDWFEEVTLRLDAHKNVPTASATANKLLNHIQTNSL